MSDSQSLRIFVAIAGNMGPNAIYQSQDAVKSQLLSPAVKQLEATLGRKVTLIIEKEKQISGPIHDSMFSEAMDADVYIADLTGSNPNVYLELGVRWAVKDAVTVIISQSTEDIKFNVGPNRAVIYNPNANSHAVDQLVAFIVNGLESRACDSPVRAHMDVVTVSKSEWDGLNVQIENLKKQRGDDLIEAAGAADDLAQRIALLRQAIAVNPASVTALVALGKSERKMGHYAEAVEAFCAARSLAPVDAVVRRELGVTYSKQGKLEAAVENLREATRLAPDDKEAWSNLGGALRRVGMSGAPEHYDRGALLEARNSYQKAFSLDEFFLYAGLNVARLDLLLSKWDPDRAPAARSQFLDQVDLCRHVAKRQVTTYWPLFDLADTLMFAGKYLEAEAAYEHAFQSVPEAERKDVLGSVLGPLNDYVTAGVIEGDLMVEVKKVIQRLTTG